MWIVALIAPDMLHGWSGELRGALCFISFVSVACYQALFADANDYLAALVLGLDISSAVSTLTLWNERGVSVSAIAQISRLQSCIIVPVTLLCTFGIAYFDETQCIAGYGLNATAVCVACTNRTYSPGGRNATCLDCPIGSAVINGTFCDVCEEGTYFLDDSCLLCPAGKYSASAGYLSCVDCPSGTYSSPGSSECGACPPGFVIPTNSSGGACEACPAGYYSPTRDSSKCLSCPAGKHNEESVCSAKHEEPM